MDLINTIRQDTDEIYVWFKDAQDDRALLRGQKMPPRKGTKTKTKTTPATATTTTLMTDAAIRALIARDVVDAFAEKTIQRNTNLNSDGS
ncbi:hypothetical protein Tco_0516928 [Tanacetum coccineum]